MLDAALRDELVRARDTIIEQLDELKYRSTASGTLSRGEIEPPDYRNVFAQLERELSEINDILREGDETRL